MAIFLVSMVLNELTDGCGVHRCPVQLLETPSWESLEHTQQDQSGWFSFLHAAKTVDTKQGQAKQNKLKGQQLK